MTEQKTDRDHRKTAGFGAFRWILLDTLLLMAGFALASVCLRAFELVFRTRVIILFLILILAGIFAGVVQLLLRIHGKALRAGLIGGFVLLTSFACLKAAPIAAFALSDREHVVKRDGKKYVAHVSSFLDTYVYYHEYRGPFVEGAEAEIEEYCGEGAFDPLESHTEEKERQP